MDLETSRIELRAILMNDQIRAHGRELQEATLEDLVRLTVQARLKRCGGEMRLVIGPEPVTAETVTPIVKAIVRAHQWREGVLNGNTRNQIPVTKRLGLKGEYLRRVFGCAFLAPDIVEAMLDGHQPANLTLKRLTRRRLPLAWAEQRIQLGFPARACGHRIDP
jgi:site-specific DNA recombinase